MFGTMFAAASRRHRRKPTVCSTAYRKHAMFMRSIACRWQSQSLSSVAPSA